MDHLIRPEWFEPLHTLVLLLIGAVSIFLLIKGADRLVAGASGFAYRVGMSKIIVGATIVALGTTSPEVAVSVMSAWKGESGLALGNAVGSIICDTGLIFGLGCVLTVLPADRFVLQRQGRVQLGAGLLLATICYGIWWFSSDAAVLGRSVGLLFLALLAGYLWISIRWSQEHREGEPFQIDDDEAVQKKVHEPIVKLFVWMVIGLLLVLLCSHILIICVQIVAERWHVPKVVIASTIVALGTSLPELVVGMTAVVKGHKEILVGNVIGADILNVLFVVGASAAAAPLPLRDPIAANPNIFLVLPLPTMLIILVLFRVFIFRSVGKGCFARWMGIPLLAIYVAFAAVTVWVSLQ